jgi:hypothetical protein
MFLQSLKKFNWFDPILPKDKGLEKIKINLRPKKAKTSVYRYIYGRDITGSRGDTNETSDHALCGSNHRGLSKENNVKKEPGQQAGSSAHMGVKNGQRCICTGSERTTAVETTPPHPKQPSTCQHQ